MERLHFPTQSLQRSQINLISHIIVSGCAAKRPVQVRVLNVESPPPESMPLSSFKALPASSQESCTIEGNQVIVAVG